MRKSIWCDREPIAYNGMRIEKTQTTAAKMGRAAAGGGKLLLDHLEIRDGQMAA
jgi:hypothetical protein